MSALDSSVVNAVLPVINQSLGGTISRIEWVVTIYLLVVSGLLLSFGRLGDLRGHRRYYMLGFALFVSSSALCGTAGTAGALVLYRVIQGVGAALLFANSPAILTKNFSASHRGKVLGLQAGMTYMGLTVGPSLGGWLTDLFGWRAVFYINVPLGLAALGLSQLFIPSDAIYAGESKLDIAGSLSWIAGLGSFLLFLNQGHAYGWTSAPMASLLAAAILLLTLFFWLESRVHSPMLDLRLFRSRVFSRATIASVLNYICVYSIVFLAPFYLIQGRNFSPGRAGLLLSVPSTVRAVVSPVFGTLSDRIGARAPSTAGMVILAGGLFLLSRLGAKSPVSLIIVALGVAGLGAGMFVSPNTSALMGAAPRNRQGIAAGVMATGRNVGMALGVGLAGAFMTTGLAHTPEGKSGAALFGAVDRGFLAAGSAAVVAIALCWTGGPSAEENTKNG